MIITPSKETRPVQHRIADTGERVGLSNSIESLSGPLSLRQRNFSLLRVLGFASLLLGVRGQLFPAALELSSLDGTIGFTLNGDQPGDWSGASISCAGDVNGDGIADLVIGAPEAGRGSGGEGPAGKSYVVFGGPGVGAGGTIELASLDGTNGFTINGDQPGDVSGTSVSSAGDVNDDGIADLLIGARGGTPAPGRRAAGKTYVVFGKPGLGVSGTLELSGLNGATGFILNGDQSGEQSGVSISGVDDVNGDGIDDVLIGAPGLSGFDEPLRSYVVFGKRGIGSNGAIELSSLNGTAGFILNDVPSNAQSGASVAGAGDVNGDGVADVLIGAYGATPDSGRFQAGKSYVVFGAPDIGIEGAIELPSLNGTNGFTINGDQAYDKNGFSVASAGDVNGDGMADLLIGAPAASPTTERRSAGKSYVVFGKPGLGADGTLELAMLNGTTVFALNGDQRADASGHSVAGAGDVNGDGMSDLLISAYYATPAFGRDQAGKSYVVFGKPGLGAGGTTELSSLDGTSGFSLYGDRARGFSGYSVSGACDVNGDGVADFMIGALGDSRLMQTGKTYVVFGRRPGTTARSSPTTSQATVAMTSRSRTPTQIGGSTLIPASTLSSSMTELERTNVLPVFFSSGKAPTTATVNSPPSLGLPLGIAGGICAVVSSIAAAVLALRRRRRTSDPEQPPQNPASEYIAIDSLGLSNQEPIYDDLQLHPQGYSHYVGDKELQIFNREQDASGYANLPSSQPISEYDEYDSARCARMHENSDDLSND